MLLASPALFQLGQASFPFPLQAYPGHHSPHFFPFSLITRDIEKGNNEAAEAVQLKSQLKDLAQMAAALNQVNRDRFDEHSFLARAVVPDGEGGYFVDTLGFPGLWEVEILTSREVENGALLRLAKSLAAVLLGVKRQEIPTEPRLSDPEIWGEVSVVDDSLEEGSWVHRDPVVGGSADLGWPGVRGRHSGLSAANRPGRRMELGLLRRRSVRARGDALALDLARLEGLDHDGSSLAS